MALNSFKWLTRQKLTKYRTVYLVFKEMASENILTIKQNQICLLSNNSQNIEIQTGLNFNVKRRQNV